MTKYWGVVQTAEGELLFRVTDDGYIEYGPNYSPAKTRQAFENSFPRFTGMHAVPETKQEELP